MQTGVIIRRNAGGSIPQAYLTLALEKNPTGWGAAIVTDGKLQIAGGDSLDIEQIQETIKMFDKSDITFYLCNSPSAINADDLSPFTILHHENEPQLVAFIEGKFPGFEKAGSSHPGEFFLATEYLIPKLQDMYELADGNLIKVMDQIKKPYFKKELLNSAVPRGVITLVSTTNETLSFAQADDSAEYSWGWVSQNYGYALSPPEDRTKEEPKRKGMFPNKSTVREKAPTTASSAIAEAVKPPVTGTAANQTYNKRKEKPEARMSRSNKKDWYKQRIGYLPVGWNDGVEIEVYVNGSGKLMTNSEVKKLGLTAVGLPALNNPPANSDREHKDVTPEHVTGPERPVTTDKELSTEALPLMSPTTREHVRKIMASVDVQKLIGENSAILSDPKKAQALEEKFAGFSTQVGAKDMRDIVPWSFKMIRDLNKVKPDAVEVLCWTFKNMVASYMAKEASKVVKEEPVTVQEVTAVKKSMFPSKKVA